MLLTQILRFSNSLCHNEAIRIVKLTSPLNNALSQAAMSISPARRAELARALAVGRALSDIVLEERSRG